jgi:hypothetical protein
MARDEKENNPFISNLITRVVIEKNLLMQRLVHRHGIHLVATAHFTGDIGPWCCVGIQ